MSEFRAREVKEFLSSFEAGMNAGIGPLLLNRNQAAYLENATCRGTFIHPRPPHKTLTLTFASPAIQTAIEGGLFQKACWYKPDTGSESLIAAVSGRLYKFLIGSGQTADVTDITGSNPQSATAPIHWLWQSEKYLNWTDGVSLPVSYDGSTTTRSTGFDPGTSASSSLATAMTLPIGYGGAPVAVTLAANFTGANGDEIRLAYSTTQAIRGTVTAGAGTPNITVAWNVAVVGSPYVAAAGTVVNWGVASASSQLPIGRQGVYGKGRNWMVLANGKDYIASDIVKGSSGTLANDYRDAVLHITENNYLAGGGTFTVPGTTGAIRAMRFAATLDTSLGQGPLQVYTPNVAFSNNAPVDRAEWQNIINPILTESLITNAALGHESTQLVNSDTMFRSNVGFGSLILGRRQFDSWGNTPISREVDPLIASDNAALLEYGSSTFFDNRWLATYSPTQSAQGVYHTGLIALNCDPISSLRGKSESVYDGAWKGLSILQILKGEFAGVERCFAFCLDAGLDTIKLVEILPSRTTLVEDNGEPIVLTCESASLFNKGVNPTERDLIRLLNGEIYVDQLIGTVLFETFYKPDQYPDWIPWHAWTETYNPAKKNPFRPRMGLGEPNPVDMDEGSNRPLREAYTFQFKLRMTGSCRFLGGRFMGVTVPQPVFAPPADTSLTITSNALNMANAAQSASINVGTASNAAAITINDFARATPYPSTITFAGTPKTITVAAGKYTSQLILDSSMTQAQKTALIDAEQSRLNELALNDARAQLSTRITVTWTGLSHGAPEDIQAVLLSPAGTKVCLMRHCGGSFVIAGVNLTFDDLAAPSLPDATIITSGTYKPTQFGLSAFAAFAPPPPPIGTEYSTLSQVYGESDGVWSLFIVDIAGLDVGSISGGWSLTIA